MWLCSGSLRASTEEFLYFLMWTADSLMRPSWRNLSGSFETWAHRSGLGRRLAELERLKVLEQRVQPDGERVYRLTAAGKTAALAGIDPPQRWARPWDKQWRLVIFDVPEAENCQRVKLRRCLREARFGYLQNSVWLSPDPLSATKRLLEGTVVSVEALTLFEGRPCGGESDADLVRGAWDFEEIERRYATWGEIAGRMPAIAHGREIDRGQLRSWATQERLAWQAICAKDPFLPKALLPTGYPGQAAWARRCKLLTSAGKVLAG